MKLLALALLVPVLVLNSGCGRKDDQTAADTGAHSPKMGGQLVEIGSHEFNVELLRDASSGKISLWVLDAHAENFLRVTNETVTISVSDAGKDETVVLKAVANALTGEKVGSTSQFEGQSDAFKTAKPLAVRIPTLQIGAKQFSGTAVDLKK